MTQQDYKENTGGSIDIERHNTLRMTNSTALTCFRATKSWWKLSTVLSHISRQKSLPRMPSSSGSTMRASSHLFPRRRSWRSSSGGAHGTRSPRPSFSQRWLPKSTTHRRGLCSWCFRTMRRVPSAWRRHGTWRSATSISKARRRSPEAVPRRSPVLPESDVSAEDYFATKAQVEKEDWRIKKSEVAEAPAEEKVFKSGGMFDALADEADVDPARTEASSFRRRSPPRQLRNCWWLTLSVDTGDRPGTHTGKARSCWEGDPCRGGWEEARQFAEIAKTAAPMGSKWSAMAKKAKVEKKVEQVGTTNSAKHPKKVETVEEDGDNWEFADEQQGGWYN